MDYQDKYLKYKTKYLNNMTNHLQNGGAISDLEKNKLLKYSEYLFNYHLFLNDEVEKKIPNNYYRRHLSDLIRLNHKYNFKNFYEYDNVKNTFTLKLLSFAKLLSMFDIVSNLYSLTMSLFFLITSTISIFICFANKLFLLFKVSYLRSPFLII